MYQFRQEILYTPLQDSGVETKQSLYHAETVEDLNMLEPLVFAHVAISGAEELSTFCRIHDVLHDILHVKQHRCYATGWWGGGWGGWDVNVPCTLHQNIDATQQGGGVVGG